MWGINEQEVNYIRAQHNPKFGMREKFNNYVHVSQNLEEVLNDSDIVVFGIPSAHIESVLKKVNAVIKKPAVFINLAKGLTDDHKPISDLYKKNANPMMKELFSLIGPSFAIEIYNEKPTIINITGANEKLAHEVASIFNNRVFKLIYTPRINEIEVISSLKNALAIGSGILAALDYDFNTISSYISLGVQEFKRYMEIHGLDSNSLLEVGAIGDIILTCSSNKSRNYTFGYNLILNSSQETTQTVEGYKTLVMLREEIIKNKDLKIPVLNAVCNIVIMNEDPTSLVSTMMKL
jgi:glycerol-3-phosphate dehydrogenase (NAD(P)+)